MSDIKRVVLAYSGGLDTSVILKWLQVTYNCEVVTFTADLGQGEELAPARAKAEMMDIKPEHIYIDDLREEFVRDFVFPMMRANARYEGDYLLGTSIARPLISKRLIEIAHATGADAIARSVAAQQTATSRIADTVESLAAGSRSVGRDIDSVRDAANETGQVASVVFEEAKSVADAAQRLREELARFLESARAA